MSYSVDFKGKVLSVRDRERLNFEQVADRFYIGVAGIVHCSNTIETRLHIRKKIRKINSDDLRNEIEK